MILDQYIDAAGFYRYVWQQPSDEVFQFKFKTEKTEVELQALADEREDYEQYQNEQPIYSGDSVRAIAVDLVTLFKQNPNLTATQFNNNYLTPKPWYEQIEIRNFIYQVAAALAERKEVAIQTVTEAQAYNGVRDFIAATPVRRLAKLFTNQLDF